MDFNNVGDKESNVLMRYTYDAPLKSVFILLFDQATQTGVGPPFSDNSVLWMGHAVKKSSNSLYVHKGLN